MPHGRRLPFPTTRINIRVFASDWAYLNQQRPDGANELVRDLLAAWVRHERAKGHNPK